MKTHACIEIEITWVHKCFNALSAVMRWCTSTMSILFKRSFALSDTAFHTSLDVYTQHIWKSDTAFHTSHTVCTQLIEVCHTYCIFCMTQHCFDQSFIRHVANGGRGLSGWTPRSLKCHFSAYCSSANTSWTSSIYEIELIKSSRLTT